MLLFLAAVYLAVISLSSADKCNVTRVDQYRYNCDVDGWVRLPEILKKIKISTAIKCAEVCLSLPKCGSLRMITSSSTCYLYRKHLDQMDTDFSNYLPGKLYDRECFSNDCDVIAACRKISGCRQYFLVSDQPPEEVDFEQYACGYGVTAKAYSFTSNTILLNGSYTACEASLSCAYKGDSGTFEVYFHKPSQAWICTTFRDGGSLNGPDDQVVSYSRFTVKNESVGAGYAYTLTDYEYY